MLKDPSSFRKGLFFLAIWIAWVGIGLYYASTQGALVEVMKAMAQAQSPLFFAWVGGSVIALFLGLMFLMRGFAGRATGASGR
jgi:hypothetical protein